MSRKLSCGAGPVSPQVAARYPPGCDDTGPALEGWSIGREKRPLTPRCLLSSQRPGHRSACRSPCRPSGYRAATRRGDRQAPRAERDRAFPGSGREGRKQPPLTSEKNLFLFAERSSAAPRVPRTPASSRLSNMPPVDGSSRLGPTFRGGDKVRVQRQPCPPLTTRRRIAFRRIPCGRQCELTWASRRARHPEKQKANGRMPIGLSAFPVARPEVRTSDPQVRRR